VDSLRVFALSNDSTEDIVGTYSQGKLVVWVFGFIFSKKSTRLLEISEFTSENSSISIVVFLETVLKFAQISDFLVECECVGKLLVLTTWGPH